ncbi:MAG: hypothetical protein AAGA30_11820 [Planctomycetota bacterium]
MTNRKISAMTIQVRDVFWLVALMLIAIGYIRSVQSLSKKELQIRRLNEDMQELQATVLEINQALQKSNADRTDIHEKLTNKTRLQTVAQMFTIRGYLLEEQARNEEAAAAYEVALRSDPSNILLIEQLIRLYERIPFDEQRQVELAKRKDDLIQNNDMHSRIDSLAEAPHDQN